MLVITRQLMTLDICSKLADVRGNKGNAMLIKEENQRGKIVHNENAQMKESNRSAWSSHALNNAH
jgi:hypothetical protein